MTSGSWKRRLAAGMLCLLFCGGCAGKTQEPEIYIDENKRDIAISFFAQNGAVSKAIEDCCKNKLNVGQQENLILYSDSAEYYAEEGLSYRELLLKRMESGQADDLFLIPAEDVLEFDSRGYLYDLSQLSCVKNLSEDALQQSVYRGKVFSIPLSYACFGLIWNMDLLRQYGLKLPKNREEFLAVCEVLKENGILPYGSNLDFGLSLPAMCVGLAPLYQSDDQERLLQELAEGETPISAYLREGFLFLREMMDKGYLDREQALATLPGSEEELKLFADGGCAFISSICRAKAFSQNYPFEVQMTALPVLEDGEICVVGADQRLAVNPHSEHLEETLQIVEALCTTETLNEFAGSLGKISSAKGNEAAALPQAEQLIGTVAEGGQIPNQDFSLPFNTWNTIKQLCVKLCEGAEVDEVCREYDELQQKEIAQYREG